MKNAISRFGKFLSGMVMPNIGAFIAWGFLTALFIEKGWFPNERLSSMVSPMLSYLLPILIAGQGGYMVAKERGRVIACIAVIDCICGSDYTMLMGAMVMGPLAGWVIKQFDNRVEEHIPAGFEMLVHNFSIGILGMLLAILGYYVIGPFMTAILTVLTYGDKIKKICSELKLDLSSPRVWGQDLIAITAQRVFRIIPTRMGTRMLL